MALFKIFKGNQTDNLINKNAAGYRQPVDGYAYYNTSNKWLYIDADYDGNGIITREPINAYSAKVDSVGNVINTTYGAKLNRNGNTLTLRTANDIDISSVSLPAYNFSGTTFISGNSSTGEHDANNMVSNGVYYINTSGHGPSTALGVQSGDSSCRVQAYSNDWVTQIAQCYRDGQLFVRAKKQGEWQPWYAIPMFTTENGAKGSATQPLYIDANGQLQPITYTIEKSVPSNAKFTDTTYSAATTSAAGLMSAADKTKLNGIATGAEVNVIESVSASGTAPLTLSASTSNKAVSITGSVADASTSAKGVVKLDATTLNTWINQLSTGSSTPVDADYYISQYVGGGTSTTTYHRRPMSALWSYISGKIGAAGYAKTANVVTNVAWDGTNKKLTKTIGSTTSDVVTASTLKTDMGLSSAMLFMGTLGTGGTITNLPTASTANQGYTYKVIVAGTYANLAAKIGDVFVSNGSGWVLIPSGDEPSGTVTNIATGSGLTGGPITSTGTISHSNSVTAQTTQAIYPIKIDACGHISAYGTAVVPLTAASTLDATKLSGTIPAACYTNTTYGLANYNANGLVKPWYSHTSASTGPTAGSNATAVAVNAITTTAGKYYAVEMDSVGRMFVNVPWTNVNSSYLTSHQTVTNNNIDVTWNTETTIATIGSTPIKIKIPANPNTNHYHKTGSWSGLTYTATNVGTSDNLAFTIPTGTTATTVAPGNHTHTTSLAGDTGTATITLAHGNTYKLTAGGTSVIFKMPNDNNTDTQVTNTLATTTKYYVTGTTSATTNTGTQSFDTGVYVTTTAGEISAVRHSFNVGGTEKAYMTYNSTTNSIDFIFV